MENKLNKAKKMYVEGVFASYIAVESIAKTSYSKVQDNCLQELSKIANDGRIRFAKLGFGTEEEYMQIWNEVVDEYR